jgi:hypothetical protein
MRTRRDRSPITAPIVVRIVNDDVAGQTLRQIGAALTAEGVPTPSGRHPIWRGGVVRLLLLKSLFWGQPTTLKTQTEKAPLEQRATRASQSRVCCQ